MQGKLKSYLKDECFDLLLIELHRKINEERKNTPDLEKENANQDAFRFLSKIEGMEELISLLRELQEVASHEDALEQSLQ